MYAVLLACPGAGRPMPVILACSTDWRCAKGLHVYMPGKHDLGVCVVCVDILAI